MAQHRPPHDSTRKPGPTAAERFILPDAEPLPPTPEFLASCREYGLEFDEGDLDRLGLFLAYLLASNQVINLTAIRDPADAWIKHIFDSLTLLPLLADLPNNSRIADIGSGGGLPGIPLAITLPHLHFTLIESTAKKAEYLRQLAAAMNLPNVRILNDRAEKIARTRSSVRGDPGRESFDAVLARAVGKLADLAPLTVPLAKVGGQVLLIKGQRAPQELEEAMPILHDLKCVHDGAIPTPTGQILVLGKSSATPRIWPKS